MLPGVYKTAVAVPSYRHTLDIFRARWLANDAVLLAFGITLWLAAKAWLLATADIQLHFDEAQYWEWAQRLDWSYYSKGPLVAWLIALAEFLFGKGEWQVRLFGWLAHGGLLWSMYHLTRALYADRRAAWWAVAITALTPQYFVLGAIMTTDTLLLCCWCWALYAVCRALYADDALAWYQAGAAIGLGLLAKLTMALLPAAVLVWLLWDETARQKLRSPHLWGGALLALLLISPLILWNLQNDWVMFRHEQHRFTAVALAPVSLALFVLGQLLAMSPLVAMLAARLVYRRPTLPAQALLWGVSCLLGVFFLLRTQVGETQVNWAAPIYLGWIVLFAGGIARQTPVYRRWLTSGMVLSALLLAAVFFPAVFVLPADSIASLRSVSGWRQQMQQLHRQAPAVDFLLTTSYPLAAELAFYWPERLPVYVVGDARRRYNQHDLWPAVAREAGRDALVVENAKLATASLPQAFSSCRPLPAPGADAARSWQVLFCRQYRPVHWPAPGHY